MAKFLSFFVIVLLSFVSTSEAASSRHLRATETKNEDLPSPTAVALDNAPGNDNNNNEERVLVANEEMDEAQLPRDLQASGPDDKILCFHLCFQICLGFSPRIGDAARCTDRCNERCQSDF